ncbi:hypothetical protein EV421DRAFT_1743692 [Armillaria borealis]|uniref:Uncharacterized protein n=1 Tax=Armillaria borealis TaxID=47425 RepID=A0AA39IX79_9AGAR|nr:hypothetical protein EV421DRAFT_1743692 [Armillaria borealis]
MDSLFFDGSKIPSTYRHPPVAGNALRPRLWGGGRHIYLSMVPCFLRSYWFQFYSSVHKEMFDRHLSDARTIDNLPQSRGRGCVVISVSSKHEIFAPHGLRRSRRRRASGLLCTQTVYLALAAVCNVRVLCSPLPPARVAFVFWHLSSVARLLRSLFSEERYNSQGRTVNRRDHESLLDFILLFADSRQYRRNIEAPLLLQLQAPVRPSVKPPEGDRSWYLRNQLGYP